MTDKSANLAVGEADRRVRFFIQSLYMRQMPDSASVLEMPAFSAITPIYGEAVLYDREGYLTKPDSMNYVTPMIYLKTMYRQEWNNVLERLGVDNEADAWKARMDSYGNPISGELEVRLWASRRGQTLARTVFGVLEYARAVQTLAHMELEMEYSLLERYKDPSDPTPPKTDAEISEDAEAAAVWYTQQRVAYTVACQRYAEIGPEEVKKRGHVDALLFMHPRLRIAYFDTCTHPLTGEKQVLSVCKDAQGVHYRILLPGNPISDGIGEGKPENQNNSVPFQFARVIQTLDMNQDFYCEEAFKLPNALRFVGRIKDSTGRPVASVGMREYTFSCHDGAPALFVSQGEYLFADLHANARWHRKGIVRHQCVGGCLRRLHCSNERLRKRAH